MSPSPDNRKKPQVSKSPNRTRSSSKKRVKPALKRAQSARPAGPQKRVRLAPLSTPQGIQDRAKEWNMDAKLLEQQASKFVSERKIVEAIMNFLVQKNRLTNDVDAIQSEYYKNKSQLDIGGNVDEAIKNFFNLENTAIRLVAYKEVVNKCKRYANVPLYQFYVQM